MSTTKRSDVGRFQARDIPTARRLQRRIQAFADATEGTINEPRRPGACVNRAVRGDDRPRLPDVVAELGAAVGGVGGHRQRPGDQLRARQRSGFPSPVPSGAPVEMAVAVEHVTGGLRCIWSGRSTSPVRRNRSVWSKQSKQFSITKACWKTVGPGLTLPTGRVPGRYIPR